MNEKQHHILIVNNDPSINKYTYQVLENQGYVCHQALNAQAARMLLNRYPCKMMLCDIRMGDKSGIELISNVLVCQTDLAVIIVTDVNRPEFYNQAIDLGVYGYLLKPVSKSQLLISVQMAFKRLALEGNLQSRFEKMRAVHHKVRTRSRTLMERERLRVLLEFAGATAHELNSPLSALLGNIELLTEFEQGPKESEDFLIEIEKAGRRIADIVKEIQGIRSYHVKSYVGGEQIIDLVASQQEQIN